MEGAVATDKEASVRLVHQKPTSMAFNLKVGNAEMIVELSGLGHTRSAVASALEKGSAGALYAYLDVDVECGEREVRLLQRSFYEVPGGQHRRSIMSMKPVEWQHIVQRIRELSGLF